MNRSISFDFIKQTTTVSALLDVCVAALEHLPPELQDRMEASLRPFEESGAATLWSVGDIDAVDAYRLTAHEARRALEKFLRNSSVTELDEVAMDEAAAAVKSERQLFIQVVYLGAAGESNSALIPLAQVESCQAEGLAYPDDAVREAALRMLGAACVEVQSWTGVINQYGESLEREEADTEFYL